MELNGLEAVEHLVKLQMTEENHEPTSQNTKTPSQPTKAKTRAPNTVPNNTLQNIQNNQCRYCKEEGHLAKEQKSVQNLQNDS